MVVVDLGCCPHNGDESIQRLIDRYHPEMLYGFDPLLPAREATWNIDGTVVVLQKVAAWTKKGTSELGVGAWLPGELRLLDATMLRDKNDRGEWGKTITIETFDFGKWLDALGDQPIVKMNIEGAEFPLLEDLVERNYDAAIEKLHVSWHDDRMGPEYTARRKKLEEELLCPVEPWYLW